MEIIGQKVSHRILGIGVITQYYGIPQNNNKYIVVDFESKPMELPYPSSFKSFLKAIDPEFAKMVAEGLEVLDNTIIKEREPVYSYKSKKSQLQKHKPISTCFKNTFIFKKEKGYNESKHKYGFLVADNFGKNVGIVFMNDDERRASYGQAEISFFDEYIEEYGQWRLISINKVRISFKELSRKLEEQDCYEVTIDPRKGS